MSKLTIICTLVCVFRLSLLTKRVLRLNFLLRCAKVSPVEAVHCSMNRLAGGFFVGRVERVAALVAQYRFYVEWLLARRLARTDQQVLFAMLTPEGRRAFPLRTRAPPQNGHNAQNEHDHNDRGHNGDREFGATGPATAGFTELQTFRTFEDAQTLRSKGYPFTDWMLLGFIAKAEGERVTLNVSVVIH